MAAVSNRKPQQTQGKMHFCRDSMKMSPDGLGYCSSEFRREGKRIWSREFLQQRLCVPPRTLRLCANVIPAGNSVNPMPFGLEPFVLACQHFYRLLQRCAGDDADPPAVMEKGEDIQADVLVRVRNDARHHFNSFLVA